MDVTMDVDEDIRGAQSDAAMAEVSRKRKGKAVATEDDSEEDGTRMEFDDDHGGHVEEKAVEEDEIQKEVSKAVPMEIKGLLYDRFTTYRNTFNTQVGAV